MIHQGVYNVFDIPDLNNPEVKWDLFQCLGFFYLKYVIYNTQKIRIKYDNYTFDNLEWSGKYLRNNLDTELLTKVPTHVNISEIGTEVLYTTILVIQFPNLRSRRRLKKIYMARSHPISWRKNPCLFHH